MYCNAGRARYLCLRQSRTLRGPLLTNVYSLFLAQLRAYHHIHMNHRWSQTFDMSSKRHSILPAVDRSGPKPPVQFSSTVTISENAVLQGTHSIMIQAESVVHPRCRFESNHGSILVGRRCVVQERTHIGAQPVDIEHASPGGVSLGDYVVVEVGTVIEAGGTEIGEGTTIQIGCSIGSGAKIGKVGLLSEPRPRTLFADYLPELYNLPQNNNSTWRGASRLHSRLFQRDPS